MRRMPSAAHVGVLVLDLDRFKEINDRQGHAAGDEVLVRVARVLRVEGAADDAIVARLGGDEVLVVEGRAEHRRVVAVDRDHDTGVTQHLDGHLHVRQGGERFAVMDDGDALLRVTPRS